MKRRALRGFMPSHSSCGSPCTWQRKPSSAYFSARTMPDLPSLSEARTSWVLFPIEETMPMPVTTTRLIGKPFLASSCRCASGTNSEPLQAASSSRSRRLLTRFEQPDAQVGGCVDHLAVRSHDAIGDRELQPAQDYPLQVHDVLYAFDGRKHHAGKLHLADPQCAAPARRAEPAEKEAGQLP